MNDTERAAPVDAFFSARRFALLLGLLLTACFAPVVFGFQSFVFRDFGLFGYPLAHFHRESFWQGEIPLWNPLNNCGLPFAAQWNTMVFYPGSLIYLLLPLPWSLNLFCLLHLWFGGVGMYFLARRWTGSNFAAVFAGIVFACNGLALHCLMWPNNIAALGWMPWVLLLLSRAWERGGWALLPAILAGTAQFMAGAPEAFLLTWVAAGVIWLGMVDSNRSSWWRSLLRFAVVVAGVVALSAVQLLPLLELIQQSQRTAAYDTGGWAMPAWGWANLLVPEFRTVTSSAGVTFQIGQAWTSSYYFGVVTLWLALVAVVRARPARVWAWAVLVGCALLLALGDEGFIWPFLKHYIGALGFIRYPVKMVFLLAVPLTVLAALGLAELMRAVRPVLGPDAGAVARPAAASLRLPLVLGGVLLAALAFIMWFAGQHPLAGQNAAVVGPGLTRAGLFALLVAGLVAGRKTSGRMAIGLSLAWLALLAADFFTHLPWQNPTANPAALAPRLAELQPLREQAGPGQARVMLNFAALQGFRQMTSPDLDRNYLAARLGQSHNLNLLDGIAKPDGFFSLYLSRQQDVQYRIFPDDHSVHETVADVLGIRFMTAPGQMTEWSQRSNALPVISAGQEPRFVAESETLNTILYSNFNPRTEVLLPPEARAAVSAGPQSQVRIAPGPMTAHRLEFDVTARGPTMVSISQSFYAPWKAYLEGAPVPLWRANHGFQALQVPAGQHRVVLRYEDQRFRVGAWISGSLALLGLASVLLSRRCRRQFCP